MAKRSSRHNTKHSPFFLSFFFFQCLNIQVDVRLFKAEDWELVGWNPPSDGWFKVNTDGASKGNLGMASTGGLIRDSNGNWIPRFAHKVGHASSYTAELWAIMLGLHIAWSSGLRKIILETDFAVIAKKLQASKDQSGVNNIFNCTLELIHRNWVVQINLVYREANPCANWLANMALDLPFGTQIFS